MRVADMGEAMIVCTHGREFMTPGGCVKCMEQAPGWPVESPAVPVTQWSIGVARTRWEYKVTYPNAGYSEEYLLELHGKEGWELVAVVQPLAPPESWRPPVLYFKRAITETCP